MIIIAVSQNSFSADVINGWSTHTTITKIYSENSRTLFKLVGIDEGRGHPDWWALVMDGDPSKVNLSLLLAAYTAGKTINLRCESSKLTDFEISQ